MECATAPCSVFIISTYRHASTCGDGVILNVLHDDTPLWYRILKGQPEATSNISVTISQSGTSYFYFRVHSQTCIKINSMDCDSTAWRITITSSENSTYTFDNRNDFSSVQGYNNWYYNYIVSGTSEYLSMTYSGSAWTANAVAGSYPQITRGAAHPAMKTSAANLFRAHRNYIAALGEWGITDLAIIIHAWQQHGYDVKFPDMYPSNPSWGGSNDKSSDSMKDLIDTAKSYGNLISLHENYVDMYPDSALYDVAAVARIANGNIKNAWFNRETNVRAHQVSNEYSIRLAQQQQALISQNYKPNAGYEDVDPSNLPLPCINLDNNTRTYPPTIEYHMALKKQLWNQFKKSYNGPLFGEGREKNRYDVYFAGYLDGTEAQVEGKAGAALTPEFSQNVVKTTQFNEGMGYFNRWKSVDQEASIPVPVVMQSMFDRYRLQQIIFGNIGWISMSSGRWGRTTFGDVLAEYHLMQALQFLTHSQRVTDIHYASDSTLSWAPIGTFLSNGGDVYNPVLKIEYEDGLRILANGKQEAVWTGYGAAGAAEFSNNFNNRGFSQWSKIGSTYSPMTWNPSTQRWVAPSATTCRFSPTFNAEIDITGDCRPILLWTPPDEVIQPLSYKDISLVIPLVATKSVVLSIYSGNFATPAQWTLVDQSTYENYNSGKRRTIPSLSRGQSLIFEVSGAGNNTLNLMMTIMATKVFSSSTQQFISVVTETEKKFTLPSNGFVAYSQPDNFLAYTAVHEDGVIVDYSSSNFSVYARSRDSTVRNISDIQVDGSVAFKPGKVNGFDDIYFLGVSTLSRNGAKVFTTSEKVEGQLKYTTEASFILHLEYSATMPPPPATDVAFTFYLPERWILDASKSLKSMFSFGIGDSIYASASTVSLDVETRSLRISMLSQQTISFTFTGTVAPPPTPTPTVTPTPTDVPTSSPSSTTGLPSGESAGSRILVSGFAVFVVLFLLC